MVLVLKALARSLAQGCALQQFYRIRAL